MNWQTLAGDHIKLSGLKLSGDSASLARDFEFGAFLILRLHSAMTLPTYLMTVWLLPDQFVN